MRSLPHCGWAPSARVGPVAAFAGTGPVDPYRTRPSARISRATRALNMTSRTGHSSSRWLEERLDGGEKRGRLHEVAPRARLDYVQRRVVSW
jgi:hypothetical protein